MKLDEVIPYIEKIEDVNTAKTLLELECQPNGYYYRIYKNVNFLLKHNISEERLKIMFDDYEDHMAIKYIQHFNSLYEELKEDKMHALLRKKIFLKSIFDISDIYTLRLYLKKLNEKLKGQDINYNSYVPMIKLEK